MSAASVTRWSRRFVGLGALSLVAWRLAALLAAPLPVRLAVGLYGFVLSAVFGKAYALVPTYFDRDLAFPRAPAVHFPLALVGIVGLAAAPWSPVAARVGAGCWVAGVAVFLAALGTSLRGNLAGRETGAGAHAAPRRRTDRVANAAVPAAGGYLAVGAAATLRDALAAPPLVAAPRVVHLLAAGTCVTLLFAVGSRVLPRFLAVDASPAVVGAVLAAAVLGPATLVLGFPAGPVFRLGAALEATAVLGFALSYARRYRRSDRRRLGLRTVLVAVAAGGLGVLLGLSFAVAGPTPRLVAAHRALNLLGLLGLSVVGVSYQFYPPTVGGRWWTTDRTARASVVLLAGGLALAVAGLVAGVDAVVALGRLATLAGAVAYASLLGAAFVARPARG
ncbi:MAG: hypothetical protein ABEJ82_02395 [Haloplanus sp.]